MTTLRDSLLAALASGREMEAALLAACDDTPRSAPDAWTVRDHVAHLAHYYDHAADVLEAARTGAPAPDDADAELETRNARIFAEHRGLTAAEAVARANAAYDRLVDAVRRCADEDFARPRSPESDVPVWRLVPGCGWGHVGEHLVHWHLDRGDAAAAERVARRVHDIELANIEDPYQRAAAIYNLGCFYARNGRPDEAVPLVLEALDRAPDLRGWAQEDPDLVTIRHLLPTNEEVPAMSTTDDLLQRNAAYAASFTKGDLALPPARKVAVLACMDARLDVHKILGLEEGDAHVIRNAGGVVTEDAIRSLVISQRLLGTEEVILIHHTDCGMLTFTDDQVKAQIEADTGIRPAFALEAFGDLDADVRQSIARIKASPFVPRKDGVRGFVYDVHTGRLAEVS